MKASKTTINQKLIIFEYISIDLWTFLIKKMTRNKILLKS